jgi:hypothetical protein
MWAKSTPINGGVKKECICGSKVRLTHEDVEHSKRNYEMYPTWVEKWKKESSERKAREEQELKNREWFNSLTEEQIEELTKLLK